MTTLVLVLVIALAANSYGAGIAPMMGPVGTLILMKFEPCPKSPKLLEVVFTKDDKNRKVWDLKANAPEDLDEKTSFDAAVHKWTGSEYKKNVFHYNGQICEYINKYAPEIREKAYKLAGIPGKCPIKKGSYTMKGIHALEKEIKLPSIPYGKFKVEATLFNAAKKAIGCYIIDLESKPK